MLKNSKFDSDPPLGYVRHFRSHESSFYSSRARLVYLSEFLGSILTPRNRQFNFCKNYLQNCRRLKLLGFYKCFCGEAQGSMGQGRWASRTRASRTPPVGVYSGARGRWGPKGSMGLGDPPWGCQLIGVQLPPVHLPRCAPSTL